MSFCGELLQDEKPIRFRPGYHRGAGAAPRLNDLSGPESFQQQDAAQIITHLCVTLQKRLTATDSFDNCLEGFRIKLILNATMTPKERQLAAIRGELTDRISVDAIYIHNQPEIAELMGVSSNEVLDELGIDGRVILLEYQSAF